MATVRIRQPDVSGGEWSPVHMGRVDLERYFRAARRLENYMILPGGPLRTRPGTRYVATAAGKARLVRWEFSVTDAYVLEFTEGAIRFYKNTGRVESSGNPLELATDYLEAELPALKFAQAGDLIFLITHQAHPPGVLERLAPDLWRLRDFVFDVPPSREFGHRTSATGTPSAVSGAGVTFTASAAEFQDADVGRTLRVIGGPSLGASALITGFTSTTVVTITVIEPFASTAAIMAGDWMLEGSPQCTVTPNANTPAGKTGVTLTASSPVNAWKAADVGKFVLLNGGSFEITSLTSATVANATIRGEASATTGAPADAWTLEEAAFSALNGYPAAVCFFEDRLCFFSTPAQPHTVWMSKTGDYGNFALGVLADDGVTFTLNSDQVDDIVWAVATKSLILGTEGGEWAIKTGEGTTLTPDSIPIKPETANGATRLVSPARVGNVVLFATRSRRKIRELVFSFEVDSYLSPDLLLLAEHLTRPVRLAGHRTGRGLVDMAYQREPNSVLWAAREDGALLGCTYIRDQNVVGWHRHVTGTLREDPAGHGYPDPADGCVESVCVIPHPEGDRDQVWLAVKRLVNGATVRYVEVLDDAGLCYDQLHTDATLTYDGTQETTLTPGGVSGTGVTFTAGLSIFTAADLGKEIRVLAGTGRARITGVTDASHVVADITQTFPSLAPLAAGTWGLAAFTLAGLEHLEGKTVAVVGDGAEYAPAQVIGGAITLAPAYGAVKVEVGLPYLPVYLSVAPEVTGQLGTIQGLPASHAGLVVRLHETLGGRVNGQALPMRTAADPLGAAPPLFSGDTAPITALGGDNPELVRIEQPHPLPQTVLLVASTLNVGTP